VTARDPAPSQAPPPDPILATRAQDDSRRVFSSGAIEAIKAEIEAADGAEVFFFGRADASGLVVEVEVAARGNEGAAPAVLTRARGMDLAIHNHPSGVLMPSDADLGVASTLGNMGVGFAIVSNDAGRVNVVVPLLRRAPVAPLVPDDVERILGVEGTLAARLKGYESRPGQLDMAHAVASAFTQDSVALLEAGTGTGKTFAYLVPAVLWAKRNAEKVVVSTGTIPLQEQIVTKDVPALAAVLPPFKATVVKGRSNYVSLRRASEASKAESGYFESEGERREVERLVGWASETKTGDRSELTPSPSPDAWERIESQSDNCLRAKCPTYAECHYFESRRAAARADVLVVNHALLVTDLAAKREIGNFQAAAVLPPYQRVVIDEAHHLSDVAADHLGARVTERGLTRLLGRLRLRRDAQRGLLPTLERALGKVSRAEDPDKVARARVAIEERLLPARDRAVHAVEQGFQMLAFHAREAGEGSPEERQLVREVKLRLRSDERSKALVAHLLEARDALAGLEAELRRAIDGLDDALGPALEAVSGTLLEVEAVGRRLASAVASIDLARAVDDATLVRWIDVVRDRKGEDRCELHASPLDVAPVLKEAFLDKVRTAVFSSATLTVAGEFDYVERGLGVAQLEPSRVERLQVASPFDFSRQAVLGLPLDLPEPNAPGFDDATAAFVLEAVRVSLGRAFVLFTSYRSLERVHARIAPTLHAEGLLPLKQGDGGRRGLLERFKAVPGSVLFGTDSFWEGVDVPGDGLVLVIIAKLPFRVPSEPLEQARSEAIRARGGDPFSELMLPRAVLKLKQGFGRLIRTRRDRGAVVVLDRRIATKPYGRAFLDSLPDVPVVRGKTAAVLEAVRRVVRP
jgi:ATP-dependent DNA helicase DinG